MIILFAGTAAHAALQAAGPVSPAHGFPAWYQDTNGFSLALCLDQNGLCVLPAMGPITTLAASISVTNFPAVSYFWVANATMDVAGRRDTAALRLSLEAGFAGPLGIFPANGSQVTVLRVELAKMNNLTPSSVYTVTHPFGQFTFSTDDRGRTIADVGGQAHQVAEGCQVAPCDFTALIPASLTNMGPFLRWDTGFPVASPDGKKYIGDPRVPHTVTGGAGGNIYRIDGPNIGGAGIHTIETNLFSIAGKLIGMTEFPSPLSFPTQTGAVPSAPQVVTVANASAIGPLTLGQVAATGVNAVDFTVPAGTDTCSNVQLPALGTCTFQVVFQGTAPDGSKTAIINIPAIDPADAPAGAVPVSGVLDTTRPVVSLTIPANGATGVAINTQVMATFSENVLEATVNTSTFTLAGSGGPVAGTVRYFPLSRTASFAPQSELVFGATYTAVVTTVVTDPVGNALAADHVWSFVASAIPDLTAPTVSSVTPAANTGGVVPSQVITATFSEPVSANTVNASTFILNDGISSVAGTVAYDAAANTASFIPAFPLEFGVQFTATVTTGVKDLAQNSLAATYSWQFRSNAAPMPAVLLHPAKDQAAVVTTVDFAWLPSADADGDAITYRLYYCIDQFMTGCDPVVVAPATAAKAAGRGLLAGLGGYGAVMLLAGIAVAGGAKGGRKMLLFVAVLVVAGALASSCSRDSSGSGPNLAANPDAVTRQVSGLTSGTKYFWKVVADDGKGAAIESETWSFTTQ
jgi:hypothetical protein